MPVPRHDLVRRVARRLAEVRRAKGITQEVLAERLDIATQNVRRIESGAQNLTLSLVERIAVALGVDLDFTVNDSGRRGASAPTRRAIDRSVAPPSRKASSTKPPTVSRRRRKASPRT